MSECDLSFLAEAVANLLAVFMVLLINSLQQRSQSSSISFAEEIRRQKISSF